MAGKHRTPRRRRRPPPPRKTRRASPASHARPVARARESTAIRPRYPRPETTAGSRRVVAADERLEARDGLGLLRHDGAHEVADAEHADDLVALDHGQVADAVMGDHPQALREAH